MCTQQMEQTGTAEPQQQGAGWALSPGRRHPTGIASTALGAEHTHRRPPFRRSAVRCPSKENDQIHSRHSADGVSQPPNRTVSYTVGMTRENAWAITGTSKGTSYSQFGHQNESGLKQKYLREIYQNANYSSLAGRVTGISHFLLNVFLR